MYVCMRTNKSTESTLGLYRRMWCSMQSSKVVSFPGLGKTSEEKDVEERERERGTFLLPGVLRLTFWFRWSLNDFMSLKFWMGESSSGFFHICSGKTEEMSRGENFKGSQKDNFRLWALRSWKEPEAFSIWKETQQKRGKLHKNHFHHSLQNTRRLFQRRKRKSTYGAGKLFMFSANVPTKLSQSRSRALLMPFPLPPTSLISETVPFSEPRQMGPLSSSD